MSHTPRAWLVTGCSTGLGRALAQALLSRGERVFATARNPQQHGAQLSRSNADSGAAKAG